jgi:hypothetical protein
MLGPHVHPLAQVATEASQALAIVLARRDHHHAEEATDPQLATVTAKGLEQEERYGPAPLGQGHHEACAFHVLGLVPEGTRAHEFSIGVVRTAARGLHPQAPQDGAVAGDGRDEIARSIPLLCVDALGVIQVRHVEAEIVVIDAVPKGLTRPEQPRVGGGGERHDVDHAPSSAAPTRTLEPPSTGTSTLSKSGGVYLPSGSMKIACFLPTTLYEKLFIDGFRKASYVVATLELEAPIEDRSAFERAVARTLEAHPRLRSRVIERFGIPLALEPRAPGEWLARGGIAWRERVDLHAFEEALLSTPLDPRREFPFEVHVVGQPPAVVVKVHHAVIDAASAVALVRDFAVALGAPASPHTVRRRLPWHRRIRAWAGAAQLRPRLPGISLVTSYDPTGTLTREPVRYVDRVVAGAHARVVGRARDRGVTASELMTSAVLSAMNDYNAHRRTPPPDPVGLMLARARPRLASDEASYRAETSVVNATRAQLSIPHSSEVLATVRQAARDHHHNDVALALLYGMRKLERRDDRPRRQDSMLFTLSDLTAFSGRLDAALGPLRVRALRVLASPTSFDHAGMLISRHASDLRLAVIAHAGAVDHAELVSRTLHHLGEAP